VPEIDMNLSNTDGLLRCDLLRGLVFWEKTDSEIQTRLSTLDGKDRGFQGVAFDLSGLTVPEDIARIVFADLAAHVRELSLALRRPVGIRAAALDLLDIVEADLRGQGVVQEFPRENLARMAFVDYLTGLPNFRSLSDGFENEIKRATRYGRLLSLILFDLDGFKEINDRLGHLAGNAALKHVASLVRGFVRGTDVAGRYGGDEFMILLPETPKHIAEGLAGGIRALISETPLLWQEAGLQRLTVSMGMASFPRDARTADSLMAEADSALYRAKRAGRNQVCFSKPRSSVFLSFGSFADRAHQSVHVIGDFNGWDRTAEPMAWDPIKGGFRLELCLAPGFYAYKLLLDREKAILDPGNPETVYDGYDARNSVLRVAPVDGPPPTQPLGPVPPGGPLSAGSGHV
jgi:diguanylate cyclase (GGDEF)-like protein